MKLFLATTIALFLLVLTCNAQNTFPTPTGNAGVGNSAAPNIPFLVGPGPASNIFDPSGNLVLPQISTTQSSGIAVITAGVHDGTNNRRIGLFTDQVTGTIGLTGSYSTGKPDFVYRMAGAELFRITGDGNVGIGTTTPIFDGNTATFFAVNNNDLNHVSEIGAGGNITSTTASVGTFAFYNSGLGTTEKRVAYIAGTLDGATNSGALKFVTSSAGTMTSRMAILSNGNVGIGSNTPNAKLYVNSAAVAPASPDLANSITIGAGAANNTSRYLGQIGFVSADPDFTAPKMVAYISGEAAETYQDNTDVASRMRFYTGAAGGTNPVERMVLDESGNLGVGTSTPDSRLTINGTVHSTSVLVESSVPADYVFNADYTLRPLADVKAYVDKNHHLPEIPSAAEFKKDGQNLGEMNMLLLKKVEELTLYMIELNKTVKAQQKEIDRLKSRNAVKK